jgi:hypothetical protein
MDRQTVITVLESLANGIDPATGGRIPDGTFHTGETVRALFAASTFLKTEGRRAASTTFSSAGSAWSAEEDARLNSEFDAGMTMAQIALQHGRSSGAITARLAKLGRIDPATVKSRDRGATVAS